MKLTKLGRYATGLLATASAATILNGCATTGINGVSRYGEIDDTGKYPASRKELQTLKELGFFDDEKSKPLQNKTGKPTDVDYILFLLDSDSSVVERNDFNGDSIDDMVISTNDGKYVFISLVNEKTGEVTYEMEFYPWPGEGVPDGSLFEQPTEQEKRALDELFNEK